jgi:thymidylate kinase
VGNLEGRLIVLEGVDATGKSTLSREIVDFLIRSRKPVEHFHFPGLKPGTLGELVYRIHHHHATEFGIKEINACSLQIMHIAAHIDAIESSIKPALQSGRWVVLDRFWWSTYVYGIEAGVEEGLLRGMIELEKSVWGRVRPDVLFLLESAQPLRSDETGDASRQSRRALYRELAATEAEKYNCRAITTAAGAENKNAALKQIVEEVSKLVENYDPMN